MEDIPVDSQRNSGDIYFGTLEIGTSDFEPRKETSEFPIHRVIVVNPSRYDEHVATEKSNYVLLGEEAQTIATIQ